MPAYRPLADRLWDRVAKGDGCWIWTGSIGTGGYGTIGGEHAGRILRTHRVAWELTNGPIPAGLKVLHRCDNPPCVRLDHLFLGTQIDNIADMDAKGRRRTLPRYGTAHIGAKLREQDIPSIRTIRENGLSQQAIAARFGVSRRLIRRVLDGIVWKHVPSQPRQP